MHIAIIGANGQLGYDLCQTARQEHHTVSPLSHQDIEITQEASVMKALQTTKPDVLMNTAAFHHVPKCEEEIQQAFSVNALGPKILAQCCHKLGIKLIHYSTDYVFNGLKQAPYTEMDMPSPLNTYGISKLAGEHMVSAYCTQHQIIRISGIYGLVPSRTKGNNFVSLMLNLARKNGRLTVVHDEFLTPTCTHDIAAQSLTLAQTSHTGLFHMSAQGECSWYEFACQIFKILQEDIEITPVPASQFPSPVKRPLYSVLDNSRLRSLGLDSMPDWKTSLEGHMQRLIREHSPLIAKHQ